MSNIPDPAEMTNNEITSLFERLRAWEEAFETTNPAQAKAEHAAVLEKRRLLQDDNVFLRRLCKEEGEAKERANNTITALKSAMGDAADRIRPLIALGMCSPHEIEAVQILDNARAS